jgi:hypothetical protein
MGKRSRRSANGRMVSASDLAQMGRCERLVMFEYRHGSRSSARQQRARARGLVEHEQFYREGLSASTQAARKGRCFIATCVFGEAWQIQVLRQFRDAALRPNVWGRRLIWSLPVGARHLQMPAPMARLAGSSTSGLGCDSGVATAVARFAGRQAMSALGWGALGAFVIVCLALAIAWWRSVWTDAALAERASRPDALWDAELVYLERQF